MPAGAGRAVRFELLLRPALLRLEPDRRAAQAQRERDGCGAARVGERVVVVDLALMVPFGVRLELIQQLAHVFEQQLEQLLARRLRVDR